MSNKEHVIELLPAYALGALDGREAEQVQSHLLTCSACQDELRELEEITNDLSLAVAEVDPPPSLRQELMARIEPPQTKTETIPDHSYWQQLVAMFQQNKAFAYSQLALLSLVLILLASTILLWRQVSELSSGPEPGHLSAIHLSGTGIIPDAEGYLTISGDGLSGAIVLDKVPQLEEDERYQLWLVQDGERTSAALIEVDELQYGGGRVRAPEPLFNYDLAEVTIETAEGSPQPTTDVILSGSLFP
jgi:anti-sigma-K factor RskA